MSILLNVFFYRTTRRCLLSLLTLKIGTNADKIYIDGLQLHACSNNSLHGTYQKTNRKKKERKKTNHDVDPELRLIYIKLC